MGLLDSLMSAYQSGMSLLAPNQKDVEMRPQIAKGLLGVLPGSGDAIAGYDAMQSAKEGNYGEAALHGVGLLPFVPAMGGMTKKIATLPYQIEHRPMAREGGAALLHDLSSAFGDDIYSKNALQYFGSGDPVEREALRVMQSVRGNPDAMVKVYRGVPQGVDKINPGDWVTLSKKSAEYYTDPMVVGGSSKGKVLEMSVPAKHVTSWPDSLLEFGYFPD